MKLKTTWRQSQISLLISRVKTVADLIPILIAK